MYQLEIKKKEKTILKEIKLNASVIIPLYVFHLQFIEFELIYNLKGNGTLKYKKKIEVPRKDYPEPISHFLVLSSTNTFSSCLVLTDAT